MLIQDLRIRDHYIKNKNCCMFTIEDVLNEQVKLDLDIFLPSIGKNLQRPLVWSEFQKEQFVLSWLKEISIPPFAVINNKESGIEVRSKQQLFEIIDGKQRIATLVSFAKNEFSVLMPDGINYFLKELDIEFYKELCWRYLQGNIAYSYKDEKITDKQKLEWFKFINFAGTPVDLEHIKNLES